MFNTPESIESSVKSVLVIKSDNFFQRFYKFCVFWNYIHSYAIIWPTSLCSTVKSRLDKVTASKFYRFSLITNNAWTWSFGQLLKYHMLIFAGGINWFYVGKSQILWSHTFWFLSAQLRCDPDCHIWTPYSTGDRWLNIAWMGNTSREIDLARSTLIPHSYKVLNRK